MIKPTVVYIGTHLATNLSGEGDDKPVCTVCPIGSSMDKDNKYIEKEKRVGI